MKPELLPAGAWLQDKNGCFCQIRTAVPGENPTIYNVSRENDTGWITMNWSYLKPIALTPDLLKKVCGFTESLHGKFELEEFNIKTHTGEVFWVRFQRDNTVAIATLHRLQNLFEMVMGKPLPVDEDSLRAS